MTELSFLELIYSYRAQVGALQDITKTKSTLKHNHILFMSEADTFGMHVN